MEAVSYKCPCCGAGIAFDSEKQLFKCEYCLSEFTEEQINAQTPADAQETVKSSEKENEDFCSQLFSYTCDNCGAEVFADKDTVADFCYYCHAPVVCDGRLSGQLRPTKIIPFAFDRKEAEQRFLKFARKKWFVPKDYFSAKTAENIRGVYYPFWLADADLSASCRADGQRVRTWQDSRHIYTETSFFKLFRAGDIHFEDITVGAFAGQDKEMIEGILPFPSEALKPFSMAYLSGFLAKKRNTEREQVSPEVKTRICTYSTQLLRDTISGYTGVTAQPAQTLIKTLSWDYALMPLWILTYKMPGKKKDKIYTYAINGHTGRVWGRFPVSPKRLWILFGIIAVLTALIVFLLGGSL